MTQNNYQATYLNGETKIFHTYREISEELKLDKTHIPYIIFCNGKYNFAITCKLSAAGIKKIIKLESSIVPYKKRPYVKKVKKWPDGRSFRRLEPDEAIEYYSKIYGGNWKYNEEHKIVVSDEGLAGSLDKRFDILKRKINTSGYVGCCSSTIHKIVWETFKGKVPVGYDVDHIDNNKLNNKLSNLQLLTHKENCKKRDANGHVKDKRVYCFLEGELIKSFPSCAKAADWIMETGQCETDNPYAVRINIHNAIYKNGQKTAYDYEWSFSSELGK